MTQRTKAGKKGQEKCGGTNLAGTRVSKVQVHEGRRNRRHLSWAPPPLATFAPVATIAAVGATFFIAILFRRLGRGRFTVGAPLPAKEAPTKGTKPATGTILLAARGALQQQTGRRLHAGCCPCSGTGGGKRVELGGLKGRCKGHGPAGAEAVSGKGEGLERPEGRRPRRHF